MRLRTLLILACCLFALRASASVELGIDRLEKDDFAPLRGKRVGLITNQTGVNSQGVKTRVILRKARGVNLVALFTPEHGLDGTELAGRYVSTRKDALTGLTAYSLYGPTRKPTAQMLKGIDVLVYDLQDIGARSYTYISTMARCMEAAGEAGIEFMVLDRPNPLGGSRVGGPPVDSKLISFVGQIPVPYQHGMTCGELAKMLNEKKWMAARCKLRVIAMKGWHRHMVWSETGLRWVQTSPNIPRADSSAYYVATGIVGSLAGLETGCGGPLPFELCAAPWLNAESFTKYVNDLQIAGVSATPYHGGGFSGCRLHINPRAEGDLSALALYLLGKVNQGAHPGLFERSNREKLDIFYKVYGSYDIRNLLASKTSLSSIVASWKRGNARFESERRPFLLY